MSLVFYAVYMKLKQLNTKKYLRERIGENGWETLESKVWINNIVNNINVGRIVTEDKEQEDMDYSPHYRCVSKLCTPTRILC